jgi:aspartokinase/homoserine dehydrogenase 1
MKVLKFGGTSVANAENISKVIAILKKSAQNEKLAVVVSALGGTTDLLLEAGAKAQAGNNDYLKIFKNIENRHLETVRALIPIDKQSAVLGGLKKIINELESTLEGICLLREFSDKTHDKIVSFGERLSSYIVFNALKSHTKNVALKDSRELVITDNAFTQAIVFQEETHRNIENFFKNNKAKIVVLPGFVAANKKGETTTLGTDCCHTQQSRFGNLDRCQRYVHRQSQIGQRRFPNRKHLLPRSDGAVSFWGKSPLSAYHTTCVGKRNSVVDQKHL